MMRSLVCVAAAQQLFQPALPGVNTQTRLRGALEAPVVQVVAVPVTPAPSTPASVSTLAVLAGVVSGVAAAALTSGFSSTRARRTAMQLDVDAMNTPSSLQDPRLGNPFEDEGPRVAKAAYQPRGISDATVAKKQYIENEDEPWHSTAKGTVAFSESDLESAYASSLPFLAAEEALIVELAKADTKDAVKSIISKAKESGARAGSKAMQTAEKTLKAFETKSAEEAMKARPKAPKKAGAQAAGWDGMKRKPGAVHSTAGFL